MKKLAIAIMLSVSSSAMAWPFGGLDINEIKKIQEQAYQSGKACLRGDTLHSCSDFVKGFSEFSDMFIEHEDEISENLKKNDPEYQQIMVNGEKLQEIATILQARNRR